MVRRRLLATGATLSMVALGGCSDTATITAPALVPDVLAPVGSVNATDYKPPMALTPALLHTQSQGFDNNGAGLSVGVSYTIDPFVDGIATIWNPSGVPTPISVGGGAPAVAYGINSFDEVVGVTIPFGPRAGFFRQSGGNVTVLFGPPGTTQLEARDVNDQHVVVGGLVGPGGQQHAFRYSVATGYGDLHPAGPWVASHAEAINVTGTIVGWASLPNGERHAARWSSAGVFQDLGLLPAGGTFAEPMDINTPGAIGGQGGNAAAGIPFLWRQASGYTTNPTANSAINGVSDLMRLTGYTPFNGVRRAWTKFGGGPTTLLPNPAGFNSGEANAVTICGSVTGSSRTAGGFTRATYWERTSCD
ncbi:MAG: hypothetical protein U0132_13810 [Gemmatimonadaceae bacterium]